MSLGFSIVCRLNQTRASAGTDLRGVTIADIPVAAVFETQADEVIVIDGARARFLKSRDTKLGTVPVSALIGWFWKRANPFAQTAEAGAMLKAALDHLQTAETLLTGEAEDIEPDDLRQWLIDVQDLAKLAAEAQL